MTREQKLDRAVREAMRLIRGDGPISEDRADEAWRILRAALSTPADAPAPAEQEVCIACGKPWPCEHATVRQHLVAAPPPRPDEDGECPECGCSVGQWHKLDCDEGKRAGHVWRGTGKKGGR